MSRSLWRSFSRSQISAFVATIFDYCTLTAWVELAHFYYPYGVAMGCAAGATVNFLLNRYWSFQRSEQVWHHQAFRYTLVSAGSLILNTVGVFLLTEFAHLYYLASRVMVSIIIALIYNYPLHQFYVFKKRSDHECAIHQ